jgi:hypothetical protein
MCNDRSSFSTFKKLSLPIVIELGDNNSVIATHYGFVDVIQGYQVEALHTPTFRLSLLSINQLDLGGHTTIFRNGKCSITSPSSCTLAGKLINGIYIIVPATALLSSTTENGRKRKRDSSLRRVLIAEPTIEPTVESSRAPIAAKIKSTRKSLTIPESRLWHRRLAHMNPTVMKSLIGGYTHDDSMCIVCIQAKHKQKFIRVPVKRTTKPFELVHSDVCGPFSTLTFGDNRYYILFIDDYTRYTSVWLLPNKKAETCTSAYQSFQARVDSMGYEVKRFRCDNGRGEYDNKTFRLVLAARGTTYEPCPPYAHHKNGVAERMIRTITEKARAMMIDSQAPIQFWGEAVNTAVYLHQRSPNEGLKRKNDRDGYQAPYEMPYEMLHGFGKPTHDADGNKISYQASLHNLRRFGCYASRLIPEVQRRGKFGPRSKPCMMVGYTHDSKTLWRIWDPEFQRVRAQSEVVFDEERNAHMSCQHESNEIDMFGLSEDEEYVEETDTGDEPLRGQDSQPTHIGKRPASLMHEAPDEEAEIARSRRLRQEDQTAQRSAAEAENAHSQRLRREDQTAQRSAAAIKKSSRVPPASPAPPIATRVTRSQGKNSAEALTASEATGDPFTYAEAMESPQRDHWKRAMEEESTSILLNNTFSALNSREARQLQVKPIGSKWVYKTKPNPDGSTWYKARLVIKGYEQTDFGETYAPVGKLTTFRYLISLIGRYGSNMDHLDVVTAFLNSEIDADDIYVTLPEGWPEVLNAAKIIVRLRKALYGLKQAPRLWHDDFNAFLLSLEFTQSLADPNLYLRSDGILILLYVEDISMSYPEAAAKAAIKAKAKLSQKYKITNLGPAHQFHGIEIHRDGSGVSLSQKPYITTILRGFDMEHTHDISTPMDPNVKLDLAKDRGEKELEDITDYQAVMGSPMYAALATRPDISYAVAPLSRYNSRPFTSHMTAAKRVLQYLKSTDNF